ncbi:MFS transporter [Methylobacillus flagellatus]|uniref:MFS transporter n=1 Tax=Methylobacillus flagellatus TaxID=405 RepID=UPI002853D17A|nr:MFS transporter [Methylobacillus flagellatus]MDR5170786.1 MFS transporter [Methylobacillus flagellatus]
MRRNVLIVVMLVVLGINLRPIMATIGPLTDYLLHQWQLSYGWISLLNGVPIIMMGLGALTSYRLLRLADLRRLISFALLILGISTLCRLIDHSPATMIASAVMAGLGIALAQAFLPIVIKRQWPGHTASFMGIYVSAIMAGAAISAAGAPILLEHAGAALALGSWGWLAAPALLMFLRLVPVIPPQGAVADTSSLTPGRFWRLAVFFGLGTSGFTCMLAWLPPHFLDLGYPPTQAGLALALLSATEVVSGLVLSQLAARSADRRPWVILALLLAIAGMLCLNAGPNAAWLGVVLAGVGVGALFPLSLIICMDHLEDAQAAGIVTARVQGVGYLIAGILPMLAGVMRDTMHHFGLVWIGLAAVFAVAIWLAVGFDPKHYARYRVHWQGMKNECQG